MIMYLIDIQINLCMLRLTRRFMSLLGVDSKSSVNAGTIKWKRTFKPSIFVA